jgi:hypothetical protein
VRVCTAGKAGGEEKTGRLSLSLLSTLERERYDMYEVRIRTGEGCRDKHDGWLFTRLYFTHAHAHAQTLTVV